MLTGVPNFCVALSTVIPLTKPTADAAVAHAINKIGEPKKGDVLSQIKSLGLKEAEVGRSKIHHEKWVSWSDFKQQYKL